MRSRLDPTCIDDDDLFFAGQHHARYIDPAIPMHVISRVFQGRHLLRPCPELNAIIVGVVGRALQHYAEVRLYAMAFMSNHVHFMLRGTPEQVPAFVGFIKREISLRWGHRAEIGWRGTMWHEYVPTALPTDESQVQCLRYILSQGVKEGLVARPEEWPGVHCARALVTGVPLAGTWLNATDYSRAADAQSRRRAPKPVVKADYARSYQVQFTPIPAWEKLDVDAQHAEVQRLIDQIVAEGATARAGRAPLGAGRVCRIALDHKSEMPIVPWLQRRRRMICWASPNDPATRQFVKTYWSFQQSFRAAAHKDNDGAFPFPPGSFAPGGWTPRSEAVQAAA